MHVRGSTACVSDEKCAWINSEAQMIVFQFTFTRMRGHIQHTRGSKLDGYKGWATPAAGSHNRVRGSGTLPAICTEGSRRVQQATPVTIFMTLSTGVFGVHQARHWEPNPSISLKPHMVSWWSLKHSSWPPPSSPQPPHLNLNMTRHAVASLDYLVCKGGSNGVFPMSGSDANTQRLISICLTVTRCWWCVKQSCC